MGTAESAKARKIAVIVADHHWAGIRVEADLGMTTGATTTAVMTVVMTVAMTVATIAVRIVEHVEIGAEAMMVKDVMLGLVMGMASDAAKVRGEVYSVTHLE